MADRAWLMVKGEPGGGGDKPVEWNLLYLNWSMFRMPGDRNVPRPPRGTPDARTCFACLMMVGEVFRPEDAPFLPAHPNCRCFYVPTTEPATVNPDTFWDDWREQDIRHWMFVAAYALRRGDRVLPGLLERLRELAEAWNDERYPGWREELPENDPGEE